MVKHLPRYPETKGSSLTTSDDNGGQNISNFFKVRLNVFEYQHDHLENILQAVVTYSETDHYILS